MSADYAIRPKDVAFRQVGEGLSQSFKCGQCQQHKIISGRRLKTVTKGPIRGLKAHVCAECAKGGK